VAVGVTRLIAERKKFLRALKPKFRKTDAALELVEREIVRILNRRKALPEEEDLASLLDKSSKVVTALTEAIKMLEKGYIL